MNKEIKIFKNTNELSEFLGNFWKEKINKLEENKYYSIALSGGSTPIKIFDYLSEIFRDKIKWNKIKFFWGDERCVPPTDRDSNFKLANDHLFKHISIDEANIFRIKGERDPSNEAKDYSKILETNLPIERGYPKFDFILLGLGEDGHTASIFPYQIELFNSAKYCEVAEHPSTGQKRITITGNVINNAEAVVFTVVGENKEDKIFEILNNEKSADLYPAKLVNPKSGNLLWLLDRGSAKRLL
ncbi:6-phosphogluconolactonase, eukaryotic type [hydrothermal vent metagenome]|uniref:6-phosphogluconolactonase, eukaryotic type n=1 Tax=hydrothermal vent metagenome TaxID=652676 RepID=A0A3B1CQQ1_9ZZZZ